MVDIAAFRDTHDFASANLSSRGTDRHESWTLTGARLNTEQAKLWITEHPDTTPKQAKEAGIRHSTFHKAKPYGTLGGLLARGLVVHTTKNGVEGIEAV